MRTAIRGALGRWDVQPGTHPVRFRRVPRSTGCGQPATRRTHRPADQLVARACPFRIVL